ncbi:response regulator [Marinobacterium maritimum]
MKLLRLKAGLFLLAAILVISLLILRDGLAPEQEGSLSPLRVVVADAQPPFAYRDEEGVLQGLIVDRWTLWQDKTGRLVDMNGMPWADAQAAILNGDADVIDGMTITPERLHTFLFSEPWIEIDVVLFYDQSIRGITDAESARGFLVGVRKGDACEGFLHGKGVDNQARFVNYPDMVAAAGQGGINVFCGHDPLVNFYLGQQGLEKQFRHTEPLYTSTGRWAVPVGDARLRDEIAAGFGRIRSAESEALWDKWLGITFKAADVPAWVSWVLYASMFLLLALFAALVWLRLLRRSVEQRTAELAESEERFRMLFENTRQAIALMEDGRFIAANQATLDMLNMRDFSQLKGKTPLDISPENQPDGERSAVALLKVLGAVAAQGSVRTEWQSLRANGDDFPAEIMLTAIRRDDRDILHIVWNDISIRKQAEAELQQHRLHLEELVAERTQELSQLAESLQEANSQQQALFDAAMAGILFVRDRRVLRCNRGLEQMLGYDSGELLGQSTRCWYPDEETFVAIGEHLVSAHQRQGYFSEEHELVRKDGSRFWGRMQARAIDPDDLSKGMVGMLIDITAERAAMAQMEQARRLAEEAARTKADFLANMSHEIRTPMNAIIGMTHLLQRTELDERQHNFLTKVERSSRHLLSVINDILDFSKIEAGKMPLEQVEFSLEDLVTEVSDVLAARVAEKGLELIVGIDARLPDRLIGDPLRLQQILLNFANNAVKFTDSGEIEIRAEYVSRQGRQVELRLSVRDTGIGMSQEQQNKLFRSFSQADGSTTRKYGGSGLGLVISKRLAELMGGQVNVDSTLGEGACFQLSLLLEAAAEQPGNRLLPMPDLRGLRVLVVDDNRCARDAIGDMLTLMQFQPDAVASGREALERLAAAQAEGKPYQLVLLDWQMPGQDGLETARCIRSLYPKTPPRLALLTPFGIEPPNQLRVKLDAVLTKPVQPSQLFDTLIQLLQQDSAPRSNSEECRSSAKDRNIGLQRHLPAGRVLLVEDNVLNQEVAVELLRQGGLAVDVASNGAQALERVSSQQYDLVLMDMQMPVMDGLTATRRLRAQKDYKNLPIVAMTANVMADDREACIAAGMDDYLAKPIDPEKLWAALRRWIKPEKSAHNGDIMPATGSSSESECRLPDIDGLDMTTGLRLALHDSGLYRQLLQRFLSGQQKCDDAVREALSRQDVETALRLVHTLKGNASQIGAARLAEQAAAYEQKLKEAVATPAESLPQPPEELFVCLKQLLQSLHEGLSENDLAPAVAVAADVKGAEHLCAQLEQLLAADDFGAGQLLHDESRVFRQVLGRRYEPLCKAIDNFEYGQALMIIRGEAGRD